MVRACATEGCARPVVREPPCAYCEGCCYDQLGEEIERRPIGAVYANDRPTPDVGGKEKDRDT